MFIYRVPGPRLLPAVPCLMSAHIKRFAKKLSVKSGFNWQVIHISYKKDRPEVFVAATDLRPENDWIPQFSFGLNPKSKEIYIHILSLPTELQRKGLGTYCVKWLKNFARIYGCKQITLGSFKKSEVFWIKMGFSFIYNKSEHFNYF